MKRNIRDLMGRQAKGLMNRPELVDKRPKGVLFSTEGPTWWNRVRNIKGHKGQKSEKTFDHLNDKFWSEGDDPV